MDIPITEKDSTLKPPSPSCSIIRSISEYLTKLKELREYEKGKDIAFFFRGHSDVAFNLIPSIYRWNEKGEHIVNKEYTLYHEITSICPEEFRNEKTCFEKLVKMQHYNIPTRLLDLTSNPLVALYFACLGKDGEQGEVIILNIEKKDIKYSTSDTVALISNLAKSETLELDNILFTYLRDNLFDFHIKLSSNIGRKAKQDIEVTKAEFTIAMSINPRGNLENGILKLIISAGEKRNHITEYLDIYMVFLIEKLCWNFLDAYSVLLKSSYNGCAKEDKTSCEKMISDKKYSAIQLLMLNILDPSNTIFQQQVKNKFNETSHENNTTPNFSDKELDSINNFMKEYVYKEIIDVLFYNFTEYFNKDHQIGKLYQNIREDKPHFIPGINFLDLGRAIIVKPYLKNPRIIKQNGAFLLFGIKNNKTEMADIPEKWLSSQIIVIHGESKKEILKELEILGIDRASLFTDFESQTAQLRSKYNIQ